MSPNKYTANVLDSMLRGRDLIYSSQDTSLSLEEFAMGVNLTVRDLDLCWGYASVEPQLTTNYAKEAVISIGVTRQEGDLLNIPSVESGLSLSSLLDIGGAEPLQNVYAFGSIFLQSNTAPTAPTIVPLLLRGGTNGTGTRILMNKDFDIDTAISALQNGDITPVAPPSSGFILEIYRFIMDITYYDSNESYKNRIETHLIDVRKPRGWGGYAEENMGVTLIPAAITNYNNVIAGVNISENAVQNIVNTWVQLPTWEPDFLHYWQKSGSNIMPARLEQYLSEVLGITLIT
jgi:hypothetical protein